MIKKVSISEIQRLGLVVALFLSFIFAFVVFLINLTMSERIFLLLIFGFMEIVSVSIVYLVHKKVTTFSIELGSCLDDMINGKKDVDFVVYEETLMAKVQFKMKRLYEIMQQQSMKSLGEKESIKGLVSDISHQVKTPIANIKMYNQIMQDRPITFEKQEDFLDAISLQIDKLDFLMQSLVKMSRLETGVFEIDTKQTLIYITIAQALSGIVPKAEAKKIDIIVECEENIVTLHDEKWTIEAIFNILENAVKYNHIGGKIRVSVSRWEFYTKIDISDTGKGISEKSYATIFKRFYREPEVHNQEGIGIGLYLAREIMTLQNGYIEVKSQLGIGTTFSVFIPNY